MPIILLKFNPTHDEYHYKRGERRGKGKKEKNT